MSYTLRIILLSNISVTMYTLAILVLPYITGHSTPPCIVPPSFFLKKITIFFWLHYLNNLILHRRHMEIFFWIFYKFLNPFFYNKKFRTPPGTASIDPLKFARYPRYCGPWYTVFISFSGGAYLQVLYNSGGAYFWGVLIFRGIR